MGCSISPIIYSFRVNVYCWQVIQWGGTLYARLKTPHPLILLLSEKDGALPNNKTTDLPF